MLADYGVVGLVVTAFIAVLAFCIRIYGAVMYSAGEKEGRGKGINEALVSALQREKDRNEIERIVSDNQSAERLRDSWKRPDSN